MLRVLLILSTQEETVGFLSPGKRRAPRTTEAVSGKKDLCSIIPGIKPLKTARQLNIIPKTFKVDIPQALATEVLECKTDEEVRQVGIEWCIAQCRELIASGVPSLHFYTVSATDSVKQVAKAIY